MRVVGFISLPAVTLNAGTMETIGIRARIFGAASALGLGTLVWSTPGQAAAPFPCTWGPGERQIGQTMQGPVVVPLCIYEAPPEEKRQDNGSDNPEDDPYYVPGYIPGPRPEPPKGWQPLYGAYVVYVTRHDENGNNAAYGYAYVLNQHTPQEARDKVVAHCLEYAMFPDAESGDCVPQMVDHPYFVMIQYPDLPPYSQNERGLYKAFEAVSERGISGKFVEREPGKWEYCTPSDISENRPCAILIGFERNGIWPEDQKGKKK